MVIVVLVFMVDSRPCVVVGGHGSSSLLAKLAGGRPPLPASPPQEQKVDMEDIVLDMIKSLLSSLFTFTVVLLLP